MPKGPLTFRLSDANRLIDVAKKNNLEHYRIEFEAGKMALVVAKSPPPAQHATELDKELAEFEARHHG